ncbi:MAG: helix-turn-helix transcriptional regulator [Clostridiales bacterium]|nr:helix-turn-helix transcriptional regulator [Clostridiales bacterium]
MIDLSVFSERLNDYMIDKNLNSVSLSKDIGVSRSTISELRRGAFLPSYTTFTKLIEYFNCSADYLLGISNDEKENYNFKPIKPFVDRLRLFLKQEGKSQYGLVKQKKISGAIVYDWLHNNMLPSIENLNKIAEYFECSIDKFLGREK